MSPRTIIVIDTSVFVSALLGPGGASREVLRRCLTGAHTPLMGSSLLMEFEAVLSRQVLFRRCALSPREREELFDAFLSVCRWTRIYYLWRPNLPDETDNHVVELAIAGAAGAVITKNTRDFTGAELRFPDLRILRPDQFIKE
jgi:putative PIN family toxin of toxin-antitoxin system